MSCRVQKGDSLSTPGMENLVIIVDSNLFLLIYYFENIYRVLAIYSTVSFTTGSFFTAITNHLDSGDRIPRGPLELRLLTLTGH